MPLLSVESLETKYRTARGPLRAVDDVSLRIEAGETLALVGESGCGKSTLGKSILGLVPPSAGTVRLSDTVVSALTGRALQPYRRRMQMVFQDPSASLNPRQTVWTLLSTPLLVHGVRGRVERRRRVEAIVDRVGLPLSALARYPHEFSGGQKQRIGIARALLLKPALVVCDEPVSALDVSIQAQILNLLVELKSEYKLSYLFISHDLGVVRYIADQIAVMYLGRIVENAPHRSLWSRPLHPYTKGLIEAVPVDGIERLSPTPLEHPQSNNSESGWRYMESSECA